MRKAAVMLIIQDGKILAVSRRYDKTKFGLPGGKRDDNETTLQCGIRETLEETGVTVDECNLIFLRDEPRDRPEGEDFQTYCYYAEKWHGEPHTIEEGEVAWLSVSDLLGAKGAFADYNKRTLEAFREHYPNIPIGE